jgi:hypothetical protein
MSKAHLSRQATDYEIACGSAPYVYDINPTDDLTCQMSKSSANNNASAMFCSTSTEGCNRITGPMIQHYLYHAAVRDIEKYC